MKKIRDWMVDKWLAGFITAAFFFSLKLYFDARNTHPEDTTEKLSRSLVANDVSSRIKQVSWKGTLNGKINVFLHYQIEDESFVIGEITYLGTKNKIPIRIIGTIDELQHVRLLEFSEKGDITGIISGKPGDNEFTGTWFSPKTRKEISLDLNRIDTLMNPIKVETTAEAIQGNYYYQYGPEGRMGELKIRKVSPTEVSLAIFSATDEPARNMAIVETDTVNSSTGINYAIEPGECEINIRFFKQFAFIGFTKGECNGLFGHNASVDGIFYKLK